MRLARFASVVLLLTWWFVAPARAESIAVIVNGEPAKHPAVELALDPWLKGRQLEVTMGTDDKQIKQKILDCLVLSSPTCLEPAVAKLAVDFTLFVQLDVERDRTTATEQITVTGWLYGKGGKFIAAQVQVCRACRNDTLGPTAEDMAKALFVVQSQGNGRMKVTTTPAGAKVFVDGELVGSTPWEQGLREGSHEVAFELPGHRRETRTVDVRRDETAAVDVALAPIGGGGGGAVKRNSLWLGVSGAGLVAVLAGGVALAMDEDDTSTPTTEQYYRDTAPLGVALIGAGVATAAVGTILYLRSGKPAKPAATAWVTPRGGGVAWSGHF